MNNTNSKEPLLSNWAKNIEPWNIPPSKLDNNFIKFNKPSTVKPVNTRKAEPVKVEWDPFMNEVPKLAPKQNSRSLKSWFKRAPVVKTGNLLGLKASKTKSGPVANNNIFGNRLYSIPNYSSGPNQNLKIPKRKGKPAGNALLSNSYVIPLNNFMGPIQGELPSAGPNYVELAGNNKNTRKVPKRNNGYVSFANNGIFATIPSGPAKTQNRLSTNLSNSNWMSVMKKNKKNKNNLFAGLTVHPQNQGKKNLFAGLTVHPQNQGKKNLFAGLTVHPQNQGKKNLFAGFTVHPQNKPVATRKGGLKKSSGPSGNTRKVKWANNKATNERSESLEQVLEIPKEKGPGVKSALEFRSPYEGRRVYNHPNWKPAERKTLRNRFKNFFRRR